MLQNGTLNIPAIADNPSVLDCIRKTEKINQQKTRKKRNINFRFSLGRSDFMETENLYSPLFCGLNDNGNITPISQEQAADYEEAIHTAILDEQHNDEAGRGLMKYYYGYDEVNKNVQSIFVDVEVHGGKLWGVATLELTEPLEPDEMDSLKDYLSEQYSDGFGEGFEQRGIEVDYGELHVSLWSPEISFYIATEQEFIRQFESEKMVYNAMPTTTEKLYSPINFYVSKSNSVNSWWEEISHTEILKCKDDIDAFMGENRLRYDTYDNFRGLMDYDGPKSFGDKVHSVYPAVEEHDGRLWLTLDVRLKESLTPQETSDLKNWWVEQINDGWGDQVNQFEINSKLGDIYLDPQFEDANFFIDTEREFNQRLGAETPAQAALYEPDAADDPEVAMLRLELIDRLDDNLSDYFDSLRDLDGREIAGMSSEIGARMDAHYYLTGLHNFHASELNYLLQFQNPLEVVGDEFLTSDTENRSDIMWNVFHTQAALQGDYPLMPDKADEETLKQQLFDRLDANLSDYRWSLMNVDKNELINMAEEITARYAAQEYLKTGYDYKTGEVEYLLQYQDPLDLVASNWPGTLGGLVDMSGVMADILENRDSHGHYSRVTDSSNPAAKENVKGNSGIETNSVIERIRAAEKEPKKPHTHNTNKYKSSHRTKSEEEH